MGKKLSYKEVKADFEREGFLLLDTTYINCYAALKCQCITCGTIFYKKPTYVRKGDGCKVCAGLVVRPFSYVKYYIEGQGYTLLSKEDTYSNSKSILYVKCPEGHVYKTRWNKFQQGSRCPKCKYILQGINQTGENNSQWKGGVRKLKLPLYVTYAPQLNNFHAIYKIEQDCLELLGIKCMYCNQIFVPTIKSVEARLSALEGRRGGEANFYCSKNCKQACPTYGQVKYPKGFKPATSREVQPELRKLVLARDNYKCQICDAGLDEAELHCHHIEAVSQNPIESADIDNCVTLCKKHHKQVHTLPDCGYIELKCIR